MDVFHVESVLFEKIEKFIASLAKTKTVPGLISASFLQPFTSVKPDMSSSQNATVSTSLSRNKHVRQILIYSAIIAVGFMLAAIGIWCQQYRSSSKAAKDAAANAHSNGTPPNTPPHSPEDLDAVPAKNSRSIIAGSSKKDVSKRLNRIWETINNADINGDEDLSVIMEGSNEDGASSVVSSTFGNFSILSVSMTDSERDLGHLDSALAPDDERHVSFL